MILGFAVFTFIMTIALSQSESSFDCRDLIGKKDNIEIVPQIIILLSWSKIEFKNI